MYHTQIPGTTATPPAEGLSGYPFKGVIMSGFGTDYDKAIVQLTDRINYNSGLTCRFLVIGNCYTIDEVETVVNSYVSLVKDDRINELDRNKRPQDVDNIEQAVSTVSGIALDRVGKILWELFYATLDGTLKTDKLLWPKQAEENEDNREPQFDSVNTGTTSALVRNLPLLGAIALGGVILFYASNLVRNVKEVVKG